MNSKLHINVQEGHIEVEGSEDFVREIYNDFKETFSKQSLMMIYNSSDVQKSLPQNPNIEATGKNSKVEVANEEKQKLPKQIKSKVKSGGAYQLVNINLGELKDFYTSYNVKSSKESTVLFVYYLQKKLGITPIGINHIYTCYKWVSSPPPDNLYQSIIDTKAKKSWLVINSMEDLQISHIGEKAVEFSLSKANSAK